MSYEKRRVVYNRFALGWTPRQLPPNFVEPYDVRQGEVMDARNVFVTPGGSLEWRRNQFYIAPPSGANVGAVKSLLQYHTEDYNQLLAFVRYGAGSPYSARLYALDTDWPNASPAKWTYGYELFNGESWTQITSESDTLDRVASDGIAAAEQAKDLLMIALRDNEVPAVWNGTSLFEAYIDAPEHTPTASSPGAGELSSGTYSYYYTLYDPDTGRESMPSPITDLTLAANSLQALLEGVDDLGTGYYKRIYRAYTSDTGDDARGETWYLLGTLAPGSGSGSQETLNGASWTEQDTEGRITRGANSVQYTAVEEDDTCYVTADEGAGNIEGFEYRFSAEITAGDTGAYFLLFGVSDTLGRPENWAEGIFVTAEIVEPVAGEQYYRVWLGGISGSSQYTIDHIGFAPEINSGALYFRLVRMGDTVTLYTHLNSDYSDPGSSRSFTDADAATAMRYIYAGSSSGSADTDAAAFEIAAVILDAATTWYDNVPQYALADAWEWDRAQPPDLKHLTWHKDRMFGSGATFGSPSYDGNDAGYWGNVLFWTALDEVYYWPGDHILIVGDDTDITGHVSWGDHLIIFKENSTWALTGYSEGDFSLDQINSNVGSIGKDAQATGPEGVMWAAADGLYFWNGAELRKLIPFMEETAWGDPSDWPSEDTVPTIAFHDGRFHILQDTYLLSWEPSTDRWRYEYVETDDADGDQTGIRAYASGTYQTHLLLAMAWVGSGDPQITVYHNTGGFANEDTAGNSYSDLHAPVQITLPPLLADPGERIQPLWFAIEGDWTVSGTASRRVKVFLNENAGYSDTAGQNVWETTPDAPQDGNKMGVPPGYSYGASSKKSNIFRRLYFQLKGESAVDFRLDAVEICYYVRPSRGG